MGKIVSILFGILATPAFSAETAVSGGEAPAVLKHNIIFQAPQEGLDMMNLPHSLVATAPNFEILDDSGRLLDRCTASVVSDHGHLLTAGHCMEKCLKPQRVYTGDAPVNSAALVGKTCNIRINGQIHKLPVLATNGCPGQGRWGPRCTGLDYALLDASSLKDQLPNCVSVSPAKPKATDRALALSYPEKNERTFKKNQKYEREISDQVSSLGYVIEPRNHCLVEDREGLIEDRKENMDSEVFTMATVRRWIENQHILQTDIDILRGSSGAGLINSHGELIGIARMYNGRLHNKNQECKGATLFTNAKTAVEKIKASLPSETASAAFECRKNNFLKKPMSGGTDI